MRRHGVDSERLFRGGVDGKLATVTIMSLPPETGNVLLEPVLAVPTQEENGNICVSGGCIQSQNILSVVGAWDYW